MISRCRIPGFICVLFVMAICISTDVPGQQADSMDAATLLTDVPIAAGDGDIARLLRKWYSEGTAAGNIGDYYDNRDGGHSKLNLAPYPQLQEVRYIEEQIKARQNYGPQSRILPYVVFGNSSTSAPPEKGGSNVMTYYTQPGGLQFLFSQYVRNNIYIYPEHRDHDPGINGVGGYGDLFPANTPFLIASQGSSGSDQSFMRALPYVLAAFRPEVKDLLIQSGLLMPTIQMILRLTNKSLERPEEYISGKAHPTVFRRSGLDPLKMVQTAHKITLSTIPPIALIKVVKEDNPVNGVDYFEPEKTEKLVDTPAVVARIFRGSQYLRKITVSAEGSKDYNNRPLKFHWVVLRGDPEKIKIEYTNNSRSIAEITVPYQERFPVNKDSDLESSRIDIGVFVHNGVYYSPPAFITFYTLDNESRTYDSDGRPLEIAYGVGASEVTVEDWSGLFGMVKSNGNLLRERLLLDRFHPEEVSALTRVSKEYDAIHAVRLAAEIEKDNATAILKNARDEVKAKKRIQTDAEKVYKDTQSEEDASLLAAATDAVDAALNARKRAEAEARTARRSADEALKAEKHTLEKTIPSLKLSAFELVQRVLDSLHQDPDLCTGNAAVLNNLLQSSGKDAGKQFQQTYGSLVDHGIAGPFNSFPIHLKSIRAGASTITEFTSFERSMIERLNAVVLSRIVFPGILDSKWRKNYVDFRITSAKEWRDVYRYSPDGRLVGWLRYQSDGIREFNAEGLLVEEKDSSGHCVQGRVVRYELEPQKRNSKGRLLGPLLRKVNMIPTDILREYGKD